MKVLAFSDPHLGGHTKFGPDFGEKLFTKARRLAELEKIDIVICCGDLTNPNYYPLEKGLELFAQIPAKHHLLVAGNHDIQHLFPNFSFPDYVTLISERAGRFNVHLLDDKPFTIGQHAFVGNFGSSNFSLWRTPKVADPRFPNTVKDLKTDANKLHQKIFGLTVKEIFSFCQEQLRKHLELVEGKKIVLCTHTVPTAEMLLYGHSPEYDWQNAWMGFEDSELSSPLSQTPNLLMWLCGHTHRHCEIKKTVPIINISGHEQPFIFEI